MPTRKSSIPSPAHPAIRLTALVLVLAGASCGRAPVTAPILDPAPGTRAPAGPSQMTGSLDEVVMLVPDGVSAADVCADHGATLVSSQLGVARVLPPPGETCDGLCQSLALDSRVVAAERNGFTETAESRQESYASDDGFGSAVTYAEQPAATALGLATAHAISTGRGVRVAILDTGIDPHHPQLAGRIGQGYDFVGHDSDPTDERDFVDNDGDGVVDEAFGHGTHVAGIVSLTAPGAEILPVRVLDADGRGTLDAVAAGVQWAVAHGAQVLNLSLGSLTKSEALQHVLESAESRGVLVFSSAGNWGAEKPEEFPAASSHASAVAATDALAQPATFTSFGDFVAVSAPGVGIRSTYPGGGYRLWSGTSMSTPFVAGTATLLRSLHPGWTAAEIMDRIAGTSRTIGGIPADQQRLFGSGMLDVAAALRPDAAPASSPSSDPEAGQDPNPVLRRP